MIYLCGPINGRSTRACKAWREKAKALLGRPTKDPMDRDYRGKEAENLKILVEKDKEEIRGCIAVLAYVDKPSIGTAMEILYAWERNIKVVVVNATGKPPSPWLAYHADLIVETLEDACRELA